MTDNCEVGEKKKMLYSMQELADFLKCSKVTAGKIKKSGSIPFFQTGRKVYFDPDKVINALERGLKKQS